MAGPKEKHKYLCTEGPHAWFAEDCNNLPCPKCFADLQRQLQQAQEERDRLKDAIRNPAGYRNQTMPTSCPLCGQDGNAEAERDAAIAQNKRIMAWVCRFVEKRGSVVFTGLSVPKRELDEARAELATQGDALRTAEEELAEQRALVEDQQDNEAELVSACIWNLEECPSGHCNDVTRVHDRLLERRRELAQDGCTCGGVLRHPCGPRCLAAEPQEEIGTWQQAARDFEELVDRLVEERDAAIERGRHLWDWANSFRTARDAWERCANVQEARAEAAERGFTNLQHQLDKVDEVLNWYGTGEGRVSSIQKLQRDAAEQRALAETYLEWWKNMVRDVEKVLGEDFKAAKREVLDTGNYGWVTMMILAIRSIQVRAEAQEEGN